MMGGEPTASVGPLADVVTKFADKLPGRSSAEKEEVTITADENEDLGTLK